MTLFGRMRLRKRFVIAAALVLIPIAVLGTVTTLLLQRAVLAMDEVNQTMMSVIFPIEELQRQIREARMPLQNYLLDGGAEQEQQFTKIAREINTTFESLGAAKAAPTSLGSAKEKWGQAQTIAKEMLAQRALSAEGRASKAAMSSFDSLCDGAQESLDNLRAGARRDINDRLKRAREIRLQSLLANFAVLAVALVVAVLTSIRLANSILRPLRVLGEGIERIRQSDFSHRVLLDASDEIGHLAKTFNVMTESIERSKALLENLSTHDGLTGLVNHREFQRRLRDEVLRSSRYMRPVSVLMLDIDHFKNVNDTYGHPAGDEVLRDLARVIGKAVRPVDVVARYGGEEIAIILPETEGDKALIVAERVRSVVAANATHISQDGTVNVTVSIGVAAHREDGMTAGDLIMAADAALYAAKNAGRNCVRRRPQDQGHDLT